MTLAILCSGQGPQHSRMFALTGDAPEASKLFAHAATLLGGRDPREMVLADKNAALHENRVGQILCTVQALAAAAALRDSWPDRLVIAGYSVGEVAAWGIAGLLDWTQSLDLVARRAEVMDAHSALGDGLLFIRGLSRTTIDRLCERHDASIAIVNPGDACIVGGVGAALDALALEATALGASRAVRLAVRVASHTPRLAAASADFHKILDQSPIRPVPEAVVRLLSGIDASPVIDIRSGADKLAEQISRTVMWADCLQACVESGATAFLELGPGKALILMSVQVEPINPRPSRDAAQGLVA